MKQFLFIVFCFITPLLVIAQQRDTMYVINKKLVFRDAATAEGKAYIEVDGIVFTGKLSSIKPDDIQELSVLKPADAKALYGAKGLNGAYLIKTKKGLDAVSLPPANLPLNDNNGAYDHSFAPSQTTSKDSLLYLVDGEVSTEKTVKALNPEDIFSVNVLKKGTVAEASLNHLNNDVIAVLTKNGAIKSYQYKFSQFSKEYKAYLEAHQGSDIDVFYKFESAGLYARSHEQIDFLYQIKKENIVAVTFVPPHKNKKDNVQPMLLILIKVN